MKIKNKTAGHAGIACFSFALKGNRAGSPHFKIVRFKWWEHVTTFDFEKAGKAKDFGRGFYLTSNIVQAQEWAQKKGRKNKIAYIYTYQLNCVEPEKWKILELLEYDKKWLEYITKNRMEAHEDDYDIVYDRMADKRYPDLTNAIEAFYFGEKEATEVVQMIRWKKEADQYCFKNERALSLLEREEVWIQKMDDNGRWTQERGEID